MRGDGTDLQKLTDNHVDDVQPTWDPSGRWITFVRKFSPVNSDLIVMNSNGSHVRTLSTESAQKPEWSMTGKWIAFTSSGSAVKGKNVRLVRPSGGEVLTFADMDKYVEKYHRLGYLLPPLLEDWESVHVQKWSIQIADCCGHLQYQRDETTSPSQRGAYLDWSDSGRNLGYSANVGNKQLGLVADTLGSTKGWFIHTELDEEQFGDWVERDRGVLFSGKRDQHGYDLYVVRKNGTGLRRLTKHPASEIDPDWVIDRPRCLGRLATIVGTHEWDLLAGTAGPDVIVGLDGDDDIYGMAGDDIICAGPGVEHVLGGRGNDRIYGGREDERCEEDRDCWLEGRGGDDWIKAGRGSEGTSMGGGKGDDVILGGRWDDWGSGGPGDDYISMGRGEDSAAGAEGDDFLQGGRGNDWSLTGGPGNDRIQGGRGTDEIDGNRGRDHCRNAERIGFSCEVRRYE